MPKYKKGIDLSYSLGARGLLHSPVDAADTGEEKFGKRASCRGKYHDSDIPS